MKRPVVSPYLLLVMTTLFWAGNSILGRMVRTEVPPIGLSFWRWALAGALFIPFVWRDMDRSWTLVRHNLTLVLTLSVLGVTNFNTMLYLGLQTTTASNAVLLMSITPMIILFLSWQLLGVAMSRMQLLGILLSLAGVVVITSRGEVAALYALAVSSGDLWVLCAVVSWGLYSVLLRKLPPGLSGRPLLGYTILFGLAGILPFYLGETLGGRPMRISVTTLSSVAYVAVFASVLAYLFWNHAVAVVGANRAGQFVHLIPVFGSLMSVWFLGERLYLYHLAGILCIAMGIVVATFWRGTS